MQEPKSKIFPFFTFNDLSALQIFQLLRYGGFILIGMVLARLISMSSVGQFQTFIMLSGMVSFFWVSGIINSMLSIYPQQDEAGKKSTLFNTFLSLFVFSMAAAGVFNLLLPIFFGVS